MQPKNCYLLMRNCMKILIEIIIAREKNQIIQYQACFLKTHSHWHNPPCLINLISICQQVLLQLNHLNPTRHHYTVNSHRQHSITTGMTSTSTVPSFCLTLNYLDRLFSIQEAISHMHRFCQDSSKQTLIILHSSKIQTHILACNISLFLFISF